MGGLSHVHIKIEIGQDSTSGRRNTDRDFLEVHLIDYLTDEPVEYTMTTSRAIMERCLFNRFRP